MIVNKIIKLIKYKYFSTIDEKITVFTSFNGKYADSPKAITEDYHAINPEKQIIWLVNDIKNKDIPDYVKAIKYGSKKADIAYNKAKTVIDNVYCDHEYYSDYKTIKQKIKYNIISYLKNKKGKKYYTFWHGTALKKIGADSIRSNSKVFSCNNTTMFLDNKHMEIIQKRITNNKIVIKLLGSPRNDILFDEKIDTNAIKNKIGLPKNSKIVLYAPSFRSDGNKNNVELSGITQINEIDINHLLQILEKKFKHNWVLVCRFHYKVEKEINWNKIYKKYQNKIINGNKHEDIVEYLKCSDILITDMSSSLFDFSLTNKPVFLYFPDEENYRNNERGLYFSIEELPYPLSKTPKELYASIENFNDKKYKQDLSEFIKKLGYIDNKKRSREICEFIKKDEKRNEK